MLNDNLFGQTYQQLAKGVFQGSASNFQMITSSLLYNFGTAGPNQMDPATYQIVSTMPVWSPTADYSQNATTLFSAYRSLLSSAVTFKVDPSKQADLDQQKSQLAALDRQQQQAQTDMYQAYYVAKNNGGPLFDQQYPTFGAWAAGPGSTFQTKIDGLTASVNQVTKKYTNDLANLLSDDQLNQSLQALVPPDQSPANGGSKPGWIAVPDAGGTLRWQPEYNLTSTPDQVVQSLTAGSTGGFSVSLDAAQSSSSMSKSWAGGSASRDVAFFAVSVGGSWSNLNINNSDESVKVEISVKSSVYVPVNPGVWFNGGFLSNLAKNNTAGGYQLSSGWTATGSGANVAFGPNGLLSTSVAALVLVFQPSVSVTLSQSAFQQVSKSWSGSAGLRVGPFTFGGSGGSQSQYTSSSSGGTTLTATSTSTSPQIIGLSVGFPGVGQPNA